MKVAGYNHYNQIFEGSNNKTNLHLPVISPPCDSFLDVSNLLSFSVFSNHAVWVTRDGFLHAVGDNRHGEIYGSLPKKILENRVDYELKDSQGHSYLILSAVCGLSRTLYLVQSNEDRNRTQLAYVNAHRNDGSPHFLNIDDRKPVALFGGWINAAAIDVEGDVIIITYSPCSSDVDGQISFLPGHERAVCVACCWQYIFALSTSGRVFSCSLIGHSFSQFTEVTELRGIKIVYVSGTYDHCLAVTEDGRVFGRGSNHRGKLGIGRQIKKVDKFVEIISLKPYKIKSAYAGSTHSLFQTINGQILACGSNEYGELLIDHGPKIDKIYAPIETTIKTGATFCVAGAGISVVYVNCEPPPNQPNRKIEEGLPVYPLRRGNDIDDFKGDGDTVKERLLSMLMSLQKSNASKDRQIDRLNKQITSLQEKVSYLENELRTKYKQLEWYHGNEQLHKQKIKELEEKMEKAVNENQLSSNPIDDDQLLIQHKNIQILNAGTIDKLKKIKEVGKGFSTKVSKVSLDQTLALKLFEKLPIKIEKNEKNCENQFFSDQDNFTHFLNELELLNQLENPNIIKTFGFFFGDDKKPPAILIEYCPYNLKKCVNNLTDIERISIILELSEVMKEVHQLGIIHCDLKPENILLDNFKHVKVTDFGMSILYKFESSNSLNQNQVDRDYEFMAPELFQSHKDFDEKVDVYAFGVILFFILTNGAYPDMCITDVALGKKPKIPKMINEFSSDLINRCWATLPYERPSFSEIVEILGQNQFKLIDNL